MLLSPSNIWTSKERSRMTTFRERFLNTYRRHDFASSREIILFLLQTLHVEWKRDGDLSDKGILSMYMKKEEFKFAKDTSYLIITDRTIAEDIPSLVQCFFHELAHIVLNHAPAHAGISPDGSDMAIMSRILYTLYKGTSFDIEKDADLMTAVFVFFHYDKFIRDY